MDKENISGKQAIALSYDEEKFTAPKVVAKGKGMSRKILFKRQSKMQFRFIKIKRCQLC